MSRKCDSGASGSLEQVCRWGWRSALQCISSSVVGRYDTLGCDDHRRLGRYVVVFNVDFSCSLLLAHFVRPIASASQSHSSTSVAEVIGKELLRELFSLGCLRPPAPVISLCQRKTVAVVNLLLFRSDMNKHVLLDRPTPTSQAVREDMLRALDLLFFDVRH